MSVERKRIERTRSGMRRRDRNITVCQRQVVGCAVSSDIYPFIQMQKPKDSFQMMGGKVGTRSI